MKKLGLFIFIIVVTKNFSIAQDWQLFDTTNSGLISDRFYSVMVDNDNNIWCSYAGAGGYGLGIVKYDRTNWTIFDESNSGLSNNDIRSMACDSSGTLWFACYNEGIDSYDGVNWTHYDTDNSGLAGNLTGSIKVDRLNNIWVGCRFEGISKFDGENWTSYYSSDIPFPFTFCIDDIAFADSNIVWVAADCADGLVKFNTVTNEWTSFTTNNSDIPYDYLGSVVVDQNNLLWVGYSYHGGLISTFDGVNWINFYPFSSIYYAGLSIQGLVVDSLNHIWGSSSEGLWNYSGEGWFKIGDPLPADGLGAFNQSVAVDKNNNIWWLEDMNGLWTNDPSVTVGVKTFENSLSTVLIYPNPSSDKIHIDCKGQQKLNVKIYNLIGELVKEKELNGTKNEIDIEFLSKGIYSIHLANDKSNLQKKLVKN